MGARRTGWGKWPIRKDVMYRMLVQEKADEQLRLRAMVHARMLPNTVRDEAVERLTQMPFWSVPSNLHTNCVFTGRGNGQVSEFHVHRIKWRSMADYALLSGVQRAKWV